MSDLQHVGFVIKGNRYSTINVNNDNINNSSNNDTNVNKYGLDKEAFHPNTPETICAEEIATAYGDLGNYAFYRFVVKNLGIQEAKRFNAEIQDDIKSKANTPYPVRSHKKYFAYSYKSRHPDEDDQNAD